MGITEVRVPNLKREVIEKQGNREDFKAKEYKPKVKSPRGVILSLLALFRNDLKNLPNRTYTPQEMIGIFEQALREYERVKANEIEIVGWDWKGKGVCELYKGVTNNFMLRIPIKDKETGEVTQTTHEIEKEDLNRMIFVINKLQVGESKTCYEIAEMLGYKDWKEEVWKERTKVYFRCFYFPIKVLEACKVISYSGKGKVTRIL